MKKDPSSDLLDWTVTDAPPADEPAPAPLPRPYGPRRPDESAPAGTRAPRRFTLPPRIIWITALVIVGAALFAGSSSLWDRYRLWQAITGVVAAEKQTALAQNPGQLLQYLDADNIGWRSSQTALAQSGLAAPLPLNFLRPLTATPDSVAVESLSPNTLRADVTRPYTAPDGAHYTFTLPQFYRYSENRWKHIEPPDSYWGESRVYSGQYVEVRYLQVDSDFARDLGPLLDSVLARVCPAWNCPPDFHFTLYLNNTIAPNPPPPATLALSPPADLPLLFDWATYNLQQFWGNDIHAPSPHAVGYPADRASAQLLQRALALQVLAQTALRQTATNVNGQPQNAFLYALVERKAVELGLDSAPAGELVAATSFSIDALWDMSGYYPPEQYQPDAFALRAASALLNHLLKDEPAGTDIRLFRALPLAPGPLEWLANGLSISTTDLQMKLLALAGNTAQVTVAPTRAPELALSCEPGPAVFARGDAGLTYLLSGVFTQTSLASWSPTGRWLNVYVGGQSVVIDLQTQTLRWLPRAPETSDASITAWVSDTLAAYILWPRPSAYRYNWDPSQISLTLYDFADSAPQSVRIAGVQGYALSPDKSRAALSQQDSGSFREKIALMPATGGLINTLYDGSSPAWSPDGKQLAYVQSFDRLFILYVANPATGTTREILRGNTLAADARPSYAQVVWSPTGQQLAFTAVQWDENNDDHTWLGTVNANGTQQRVLLDHVGDLPLPQYSADGKYLAVTVLKRPANQVPGESLAQTLIFDAATGEPPWALPESKHASFAWSPTGHGMVITTDYGIYWLAEPNGAQEKLAEGTCWGVIVETAITER